MTRLRDDGIGRLGMYELAPPFKHIPLIKGDGLELRLSDKCYYTEQNIPCYEYYIYVDGNKVGVITILIEDNFENIREVGNIGVEIVREFHGHQLPDKATRAAFSLLRDHGISSILITCDKDKKAIAEACKQLSANYLDTITTTDGVDKDRYILNL